jgi:hypothetical protein
MPIEAKGAVGIMGCLLRMLRESPCRLSWLGKQPVHPISGPWFGTFRWDVR